MKKERREFQIEGTAWAKVLRWRGHADYENDKSYP